MEELKTEVIENLQSLGKEAKVSSYFFKFSSFLDLKW
jgi:hypothetical protein